MHAASGRLQLDPDLVRKLGYLGGIAERTPIDNLNTAYSATHAAADLRSGYRINDALSIFGEVPNLFNKTYGEYPNASESVCPNYMAGQDGKLARRLAADPCYRQMFAATFAGAPINTETVTKALASFEPTLLLFDSLYDQFRCWHREAIPD